jgi:hypothetical protein
MEFTSGHIGHTKMPLFELLQTTGVILLQTGACLYVIARCGHKSMFAT